MEDEKTYEELEFEELCDDAILLIMSIAKTKEDAIRIAKKMCEIIVKKEKDKNKSILPIYQKALSVVSNLPEYEFHLLKKCSK